MTRLASIALTLLLVVGVAALAELARPAMSPEAEAAMHLGLGLSFGVGAAVLIGAVLRLWWRR